MEKSARTGHNTNRRTSCGLSLLRDIHVPVEAFGFWQVKSCLIGLHSEVPSKRNSMVLKFEGCAWDPQPNQVKVKHARGKPSTD